MSNDIEMPLLLLEGNLKNCFNLYKEISITLGNEKSNIEKKKFLKEKRKEIQTVISHQKFFLKGLCSQTTEVYNLILSKWNDLRTFIEDQIIIHEGEESENAKMGKNDDGIEWLAPDTYLLELVYALMATPDTIRFRKKDDVVKAFFHFFNLKIENYQQKLQGIKQKRNLDNRTIFLDKLTKHFQEYIDKER